MGNTPSHINVPGFDLPDFPEIAHRSIFIDYSDWMQQMYQDIKWRTLREICLPFSHDSGMSSIQISQGLPKQQILTQGSNIAGQLVSGARFFDIRPLAHQGDLLVGYFTSHGSYIDDPIRFADGNFVNWVGGAGQALQDICDQVNDFTNHHSELVILEISHAIVGVLSGGYARVKNMTQDDYNALFAFLQPRLQHLFQSPDPNVDLTTLPMSDFIGNQKAAVVCTVSADSIVIPNEFLGHGFYYGSLDTKADNLRDAVSQGRRSQLYYNGSYADSNDVNTVEEDQFSKMALYRGFWWPPPFLLELTITEQGAKDMVFSSIEEGAYAIQDKAFPDVPKRVTSTCWPTLLGCDFFSANATRLVIDINNNQVKPSRGAFATQVILAYYGPKDVTSAVQGDYYAQLQLGQGLWQTSVNNSNPLLGPDPAIGVGKKLDVLIGRFRSDDGSFSFAMFYSAGEGEQLSIDPREMNLSKSMTQMAGQRQRFE